MKLKLLIGLLILALSITGCSAREPIYFTGSATVANQPISVTSSNTTPVNAVVYGLDGDSTVYPIRIDPSTRAVVAVRVLHLNIHKGIAFSASHVATVTANNFLDIFIRSPEDRDAHLLYEFSSTAEAEYTIYEAPTVSANGTAIQGRNLNRNYPDTPYLLTWHTPTIVANGTQLRTGHWGSGKATGGEAESVNEFLLKPATNYLIRVKAVEANVLAVDLTWYSD